MNVQRHPFYREITDFSADLIPASMASFVSLFIKAETVRDVGLPIREFFIWTDDWEYTRRISRKYPCYVVGDSVAVHKSRTNLGADIASDDPSRLGRYRYLYRNDVYLYRREGIAGFLYETIRLSAHILRVLTKAKNRRRERISLIIRGTWAGIRFRPKIEYVETEHEDADIGAAG